MPTHQTQPRPRNGTNPTRDRRVPALTHATRRDDEEPEREPNPLLAAHCASLVGWAEMLVRSEKRV